MSWALRIVGDAVADLRALEVWLQEEVLDELDRLCLEPPLPRSPTRTSEIVIDLERTSPGVRHIIFMRLRRDEPKATLTVLGIALHARPAPENRPSSGQGS